MTEEEWQTIKQETMSQDTDIINNNTPITLSHLTRIVVSSSINLVLPFINGMMLGFGELFAHEICWRYNWFDRRNTNAFKIYPESRKYSGLNKGEGTTKLSNVL